MPVGNVFSFSGKNAFMSLVENVLSFFCNKVFTFPCALLSLVENVFSFSSKMPYVYLSENTLSISGKSAFNFFSKMP